MLKDYGDSVIEPDVAVPLDEAALCEGRKPALERALAIISGA